MQTSLQFLGSSQYEFIHVGNHDAEELMQSGPRSDSHVCMELDALHLLPFFPQITDFILVPGSLRKEDISFLQGLPIKGLKLDYYSEELDEYALDLGMFPNLQYVFSRTQFNFQNAENCTDLKHITVQAWNTRELTCLAGSGIEHLEILSGKLSSLSGLAALTKLKKLSVSYQRSLTDAAALVECHQLEHLEIEACGKLDLEQIPCLPELRSIAIMGRQTIENCDYFLRFPKLERLILGVKIKNGDLSPLLKLKHCTLMTDCRHYSHKNADLPK